MNLNLNLKHSVYKLELNDVSSGPKKSWIDNSINYLCTGERKVYSETNSQVCTVMDSLGLILTSTLLSNINRDNFGVGDKFSF